MSSQSGMALRNDRERIDLEVIVGHFDGRQIGRWVVVNHARPLAVAEEVADSALIVA